MENIKITLDDRQVKHVMKHLGLTGNDNWLKVKAELQKYVQATVVDKVRKLEGLYYINKSFVYDKKPSWTIGPKGLEDI